MVSQRKQISSKTEKILSLRCGGICAICKKILTQKEMATDLFGHTARFCHIYPAEVNGPRHEESKRDNISEDFLYSQNNILVLCPTCHTIIDETRLKDYPTAILFEIKERHETEIEVQMTQQTTQMTFAELDVICKAIIGAGYIQDSDNTFSTIEIEDKIKLNSLSDTIKNLISTGLAGAKTVKNYLDKQPDLNFATRLVEEFKKRYNNLKVSYCGDDLYLELIKNVSPSNEFIDTTATNAVISYLFHRCQIFEAA